MKHKGNKLIISKACVDTLNEIIEYYDICHLFKYFQHKKIKHLEHFLLYLFYLKKKTFEIFNIKLDPLFLSKFKKIATSSN